MQKWLNLHHYLKIMLKICWKQAKMIRFCIHFDIFMIPLLISIFLKYFLSISISIFGIALSISISITIFSELPYRYRYRYFRKWPYWYWYRYRYFSKVSIYRQSICHIDISNRASPITLATVLNFYKIWSAQIIRPKSLLTTNYHNHFITDIPHISVLSTPYSPLSSSSSSSPTSASSPA